MGIRIEEQGESMTQADAVAVVEGWHEALNRRDSEGVIALSAAEIEILGPRGVARGREVLRQWLEHTRVSLEPLRWFARGGEVVVAQHGVWRSIETGDVDGEADVASRFRVEDGRVAHYARYDTVEEALAAAGLTDADEVHPRTSS
jgi:hypothetical protein